MTDLVTEGTLIFGFILTILTLLSGHSKLAQKVDAVLEKVAPEVPKVLQTAEQVAQDVEQA